MVSCGLIALFFLRFISARTQLISSKVMAALLILAFMFVNLSFSLFISCSILLIFSFGKTLWMVSWLYSMSLARCSHTVDSLTLLASAISSMLNPFLNR